MIIYTVSQCLSGFVLSKLQFRTSEVANAFSVPVSGKVGDYTQRDMRQMTSFPEMPPKIVDVHIGQLLFASSRARYRSIEITQYLVETLKKVSNVTYIITMFSQPQPHITPQAFFFFYLWFVLTV